MNAPVFCPSSYQSHLVSKAVCTLTVRHRLPSDASALLLMFVELLNNKGGLIDLNETRWDSRNRWCQYLNIEANEAGMKRVTRAFSRLVNAGLLVVAKDRLGRTLRRLSAAFKTAVDKYKFPETRKREVALPVEVPVPQSGKSDDLPLPQSGKSVENSLPESRNTPSAIAEVELDKETKKLNLNNPPPSEGGALKVKGMTAKGLYGLVKSVSGEYVSMETCEGYTKKMAKAGYSWAEIERAVDLVREEIGDSGRCIRRDSQALTAWYGYCEKARKHIQVEEAA